MGSCSKVITGGKSIRKEFIKYVVFVVQNIPKQFSSDSLTSCETVKASHLQKPAGTPRRTKPSIFCRSSAVLKQNN